MATRRAVGAISRCVTCRRQVLSSFISAFVPATHQDNLWRSAPNVPRSRNFNSSARVASTTQNDDTGKQEEDDWWNKVEIADEKSPTRPETAVQSIPWYLQQTEPETPTNQETNPFAERQRMPTLPDSPPAILEPLLKHISIDLGLDYLSVLDLRELDPPPALGSNLLMVLGSARSEKHLNISADRLCRWLRTEYKLTPYADGLLGRNELKLKLRRKARRSRMLSAAGAAPDKGEQDDGIRTGWICVNVGRVEGGQLQKKVAVENFVGFGQETTGARIVVQMMTEEKRGEVDLEGLWQNILGRSLRKQKGDTEAKEEARLREEANSVTAGSSGSSRPTERSHTQSSSPRFDPPRQQVRGFHASARSMAADSARHHMPESPLPNPYASSTANDIELDESELEPRLISDTTCDASQLSVETSNPAQQLGSTIALRSQIVYLLKAQSSTVIEVLGQGENDRTSTTFLTNFYNNFPAFPQMTHWDAVLRLQRRALEAGHGGYSKRHLMDMFRNLLASMNVIPLSPFRVVLKALLLTPHRLDETSTVKRSDRAGYHALRRSLGWAFEVIEMMEVHGHDVRRPNIWRIFHEAVSYPRFAAAAPGTTTRIPAGEPISLDLDQVRKHQYYVRRSMELLAVQPDDRLYTEMMQTYLAQGDWSAFWDVWRSVARLMHPRTADMYALMFNGVAASGDEKRCQEVLAEHVHEMARELPAIPLEGDVKAAVRQCLKAANVELASPQWSSLWERCRD